MRMIVVALLVVVGGVGPARGDELGLLYDDAAGELAAGRPLVVQVQVALCDNEIIRCGGRGLGDGDDLERNLYWATSGGLRGWFERRGTPWTRVSVVSGTPGADVMQTVTYRRRVAPSAAWRRRGVTAPFDLFVVAHAWRGRAIDRALDAFIAELYDDTSAARVAAYVGHNGWMDRTTVQFPTRTSTRRKGFVAIACLTRDYLQRALSSPTRVPLLLTKDLLFAGSHALDGAIDAFAAGAARDEIRHGAARAYAAGEAKPLARVELLFTN